MLFRHPEPEELMDTEEQARAYAEADFEAPHTAIVRALQEALPKLPDDMKILDLGCGPADIAIRLASLYPACAIDAADGAKRMLDYATRAIERRHLQHRIRLLYEVLPCADLAASQFEPPYNLIFSNSLLHHIYRPEIFWDTIKQVARAGTYVFVADLKRPHSYSVARAMVRQYAADEPAILRRDFLNSLIAAFTLGEVKAQLLQAQLDYLEVREISDRHLIVCGSFKE